MRGLAAAFSPDALPRCAVAATRCQRPNDRQYDLFQRRMRIFSTKTYSASLPETRVNLYNEHPNQH